MKKIFFVPKTQAQTVIKKPSGYAFVAETSGKHKLKVEMLVQAVQIVLGISKENRLTMNNVQYEYFAEESDIIPKIYSLVDMANKELSLTQDLYMKDLFF